MQLDKLYETLLYFSIAKISLYLVINYQLCKNLNGDLELFATHVQCCWIVCFNIVLSYIALYTVSAKSLYKQLC